MKPFLFLTTLLLTLCLFLTACGGTSKTSNQHSPAVTEHAVSGNAVSENAVKETVIPTELRAKTPYGDDAVFTIKEYTSQEYRAEVSLSAESEDIGMLPSYHWELYLDMADEITEISGAIILSHEGTRYRIQGTYPRHSGDNGWDEDSWTEFRISFEITVSYRGQIHEPNFCFFSKELYEISNKKFDCQVMNLKKDGKTVTGKIRLINRSGEKIPGWELELDTNFKIKSLDDSYIHDELEHYADDDEERLWLQTICAKDKNLDFDAGETKIISFTGTCPADKPRIEDKRERLTLYKQCEADEYNTWQALEREYGGSYTKMEQYLVADTVFGMDVFFVFDEKKKDSYTATAELTNVLAYGPLHSEDYFEDDYEDESEEDPEENYEGSSIADWEIYLECEDTIESITGAKIVSHKGNVYHIRAEDPDKWIAPFSFTTFQVKVSCPEGIHPLGKTYLVHAKMQGNGLDSYSTVTEQTFSVDKRTFPKAASTRWLPYYDLYDPLFETDRFEDEYTGEWEGFEERQKWGKKMGRMPRS